MLAPRAEGRMVSGIWRRIGALVPGSRETWRHYLGEIAVVVIGVLIALGALDSAPAQERQALAVIYTQMRAISGWNDEESALSARLAVLQFNPVLSAPKRNELVSVLARLDTINGMMALVAGQVTKAYQQLGSAYRLEGADLEQVRRNVAEQQAIMREIYGSCADIDALRVIDPRLK
jgi:hypothetical protein